MSSYHDFAKHIINKTKKELELLKQEVDDMLNDREKVFSKISSIVEYTLDPNLYNIQDFTDVEWYKKDNILFIKIIEDEDFYNFNIRIKDNSKLIFSEFDGYIYSLIYDEYVEDSFLVVLDKDKNI